MSPLKVARPSAPQAVFCLSDATVLRHRHRRNHLLLTPYGRFLGCDDGIYVMASPLTAAAVATAAAAAGVSAREPPVAHAFISEWTQMEFEVRAGLRESPLAAPRDEATAAAAAAGAERLASRPRLAGRRLATAARRRAPVAAPAPAAAAAAAAASLQVVPVCCRDFLLFVQSFAVIMSTVMLIKNAVSAAVFESLEL